MALFFSKKIVFKLQLRDNLIYVLDNCFYFLKKRGTKKILCLFAMSWVCVGSLPRQHSQTGAKGRYYASGNLMFIC